MGRKNRRSSELASAAPWLVPSPRYFAKSNLLVERQESLASRFAGDRGAGGLHANHSVFKSAEATSTGLVQGNRNRSGVIRGSRRATRASRCEVVAALDASREHAVNQTGAGRGRGARSDATEGHQSSGKADGGIVGVVGNHGRIDGTDGGDSRRLVSRHAGTQQVGDSNGRDDENDGYHDQQLNQRKSVLFAHRKYSPSKKLLRSQVVWKLHSMWQVAGQTAGMPGSRVIVGKRFVSNHSCADEGAVRWANPGLAGASRQLLSSAERNVTGVKRRGNGQKKQKEQRTCVRCSLACTLPQVLCQIELTG